MTRVSEADARKRWDELVEAAREGELVEIDLGDGLFLVSQHVRQRRQAMLRELEEHHADVVPSGVPGSQIVQSMREDGI